MDPFTAQLESMVNEILSKDDVVVAQGGVSTSHLMWMRREVTKLLRKEIALAEKEARLCMLEQEIRAMHTEMMSDMPTRRSYKKSRKTTTGKDAASGAEQA